MAECPICRNQTANSICPQCGFDRRRDFIAKRTIASVPEADWAHREKSMQLALHWKQQNSRRQDHLKVKKALSVPGWVKILAGLAVTAALVLLFSAGAPIGRTEKAIDSIGTVTLESRDEIEAAEQMYHTLSAENQKKVENRSLLFAARAELGRLTRLVDEAQRALDAVLGPITRDSADTIMAAEEAYRAAREAGVNRYVIGETDLWCAAKTYATLIMEDAACCMEQGKYEEAYDLYSIAADRLPPGSSGKSARLGIAEAKVGMAQKLFQSDKLEDAWNILNETQTEFRLPESGKELREKLVKRLEQQRPQNGQIFENTVGWGRCQFTVCAGSRDAWFMLENVNAPGKSIQFYVRAGEETTVRMKEGSYSAQYTTGSIWFGRDSMFGNGASLTRMDETFDLTTGREGPYIHNTAVKVTLYEPEIAASPMFRRKTIPYSNGPCIVVLRDGSPAPSVYQPILPIP